jgi:EthD domain
VPLLQRYVQSHTRPAAYERGREPTWDGVASLWFAGVAELGAASASAEWAWVTADNPNFIAEGPVQSIVTTEHVIVA